jgi:hypothetical protein
MPMRIHRKVGLHDLDLFQDGARWFAAVDGTLLRGKFTSQKAAQAVGLAEIEGAQRSEGSFHRAAIVDPDSSV